MKIGVYGGTFDPPHLGHLGLARAAKEELRLDEVIFVPTHRSPFKQDPYRTPGNHRLAMIELMIATESGFAVSDIEISRRGVSYSVDTLTEMVMARRADYWWVMGSDSAMTLSEWKQPLRIGQLARFAVALRPPHGKEDVLRRVPEPLCKRIDFLDMEPNPISSSTIRDLAYHCRPINRYVTAAVADYIESHGLYRKLTS